MFSIASVESEEKARAPIKYISLTLDWILSQPDPEEDDIIVEARKLSESDCEWEDASNTPVTDAPREIQVELMCDECKLIFTNDLDIEKHTAKFSHFGYIEPPKRVNGDITNEADKVNGLISKTDINISKKDSLQKETAPNVKADSNVCIKKLKTDLQIQLPNGEVLYETFGVNEELSYVRLYVQLNRTDGDGEFVLTTIYNGRAFAEGDYCKPLHALGLVPNARIFVKEVASDTSALV